MCSSLLVLSLCSEMSHAEQSRAEQIGLAESSAAQATLRYDRGNKGAPLKCQSAALLLRRGCLFIYLLFLGGQQTRFSIGGHGCDASSSKFSEPLAE